MKEEKSLLDIIDFVTTKAFNGIKWLGNMVRGKNTKDTIYIFLKIIVTLVILWVAGFLFEGLKHVSVSMIYFFGSTFRSILSLCLSFILELAYFILCFVILLKVFSSILENKELNLIETNRKKDTKLKKNIFLPLIYIIRFGLYICIIPIICAMAIVLIFAGMSVYLALNGNLLISPFFMCAGMLVMFYAAFSIIFDLLNGGKI